MESTSHSIMTAAVIGLARQLYVRLTAADREACEKALEAMKEETKNVKDEAIEEMVSEDETESVGTVETVEKLQEEATVEKEMDMLQEQESVDMDERVVVEMTEVVEAVDSEETVREAVEVVETEKRLQEVTAVEEKVLDVVQEQEVELPTVERVVPVEMMQEACVVEAEVREVFTETAMEDVVDDLVDDLTTEVYKEMGTQLVEEILMGVVGDVTEEMLKDMVKYVVWDVLDELKAGRGQPTEDFEPEFRLALSTTSDDLFDTLDEEVLPLGGLDSGLRSPYLSQMVETLGIVDREPESDSAFVGDSVDQQQGVQLPVAVYTGSFVEGDSDSGESEVGKKVAVGRHSSKRDLPMAKEKSDVFSFQGDEGESLPALMVARVSANRASCSQVMREKAVEKVGLQDDRLEEPRAIDNVGMDSGSDEEMEDPVVMKYTPCRRRSKTCLLCGDENVKRMSLHLKALKHQNIPSNVRPRLAEYMNMRGDTIDCSGKLKRMCPYEECSKFANNMKVHLKKRHHLSSDNAMIMARGAEQVRNYDFEGLISKYTLKRTSSIGAAVPAVVPSSERVVEQTTTPSCEPRQCSAARSGTAVGKSKDKVPLVNKKMSHSNRAILEEYKAFCHAKRFQDSNQTDAEEKKFRYKANEQVSAVEKFILEMPLNVTPSDMFTRERLSSHLTDMLAKGDKPGTLDSLLSKFTKFINFLLDYNYIDSNQEHLFSKRISMTRTDLKELKTKRKNEVKDSMKDDLLDPASRVEYRHSVYYNQAIHKALTCKNHCGMSTEDIRHVRRVLMICVCLYTGARASVIEGMTYQEVMEAQPEVTERGLDNFVVSVVNHKTLCKGSFKVPLSEPEYKCLLNYVFIMHNKFGRKRPRSAFLSDSGKAMLASRINDEVKASWKSAGLETKYGEFSLTRNRKSLTTHAQQADPLLSRPLAKQLKHSQNTSDRYYHANIATGEAANTCEQVQEAIEGHSLTAQKALRLAGKPSFASAASATVASLEEVDEDHLDLGRFQFPLLDNMSKDQFLEHIESVSIDVENVRDIIMPFCTAGGDDRFRTETRYIPISETLVSRADNRFDLNLISMLCEKCPTKIYGLPDKVTYMIIAVVNSLIGATLGMSEDPQKVERVTGPSLAQVIAAGREDPYPTVHKDMEMTEILAECNRVDERENFERQTHIAKLKADRDRLVRAAEATKSLDAQQSSSSQLKGCKRPASAAPACPGKIKQSRRQWTETEWVSFKTDFSLEIERSIAYGKKTSIPEVRARMQSLSPAWDFLNAYQVRDKIWTEAKGKGTAAKKFAKKDLQP